MRIAPRKSDPPSGSDIALQPNARPEISFETYSAATSGEPQFAIVNGTVAACRFIAALSGG